MSFSSRPLSSVCLGVFFSIFLLHLGDAIQSLYFSMRSEASSHHFFLLEKTHLRKELSVRGFWLPMYACFLFLYVSSLFIQVTSPHQSSHNFSLMSSNLQFLPIAALLLKFNRGFYEIFEHNGDKNRQNTGCSSGLLCRRAWSCYLSLDPHCFLTSPLEGEVYP